MHDKTKCFQPGDKVYVLGDLQRQSGEKVPHTFCGTFCGYGKDTEGLLAWVRVHGVGDYPQLVNPDHIHWRGEGSLCSVQ
jgi:hypothetical protein